MAVLRLNIWKQHHSQQIPLQSLHEGGGRTELPLSWQATWALPEAGRHTGGEVCRYKLADRLFSQRHGVLDHMEPSLNDPASPAQPLESSTWNSFQSSETNPDSASDEKGVSSLSQTTCQANKALEDLDLLGKTLLQQSLPASALHVRWEKPQFKPTLRDLQSKTTPHPASVLGDIVPIGGEQSSPSPVKTELSLANTTVPLESIKPSSILPVTVYDQRSFRVLFHFAQDAPPGRPDVLVVVISMLSTAPLPVTGISFQAAVPKVMKVKLQPATGSELPAFNPILPPSAVTQVLLLANPTQEKVRLRYKLAYIQGEQTFEEMGDVEDFPPVEKWGHL